MKNRVKRGSFILALIMINTLFGKEFIDSVKELTKRYGPKFTFVCIGAQTIDAIQPQEAKNKYGKTWYVESDKQALLEQYVQKAFHALNHKEAAQKCSANDLLFKVIPDGTLSVQWQGKAICENYKKQAIKPL